ncbi:MAG: N-acetylglucosamine-6-phosphate deacetylase [Pirellulales bacterium]
MQIIGRRYDTRDAVRIEIAGGRIERILPQAARAEEQLPWIAPGFVDIQVNGYNGQEFSSPDLTPAGVAKIVEQHYAFGVTSFCPTLTTAAHDILAHGMRAIHQACETQPEIGRRIAGIHQEGPYFSPEDGPRGAHPKEHCRRPDWDQFQRLQEAAGGRICLLTMSVEFDESAEFIAKAVASGVRVAIGHTSADGPHIKAAVDAGATLSTHLGNGAHRMLRRHPNYIWDQLAEDRLTASLIVDGHHLPPEVVKSFVRAKTPRRIILVSDVSGLAGLPVGRHTASGCELEILPDGRLVIAGQDQLLAGASLPIGVSVANVMRFAGVDLPTAVDMATAHPAAFLGHSPGGLRPGDAANLVLFDLHHSEAVGPPERLTVRGTVADGKMVYESGGLNAAAG